LGVLGIRRRLFEAGRLGLISFGEERLEVPLSFSLQQLSESLPHELAPLPPGPSSQRIDLIQ